MLTRREAIIAGAAAVVGGIVADAKAQATTESVSGSVGEESTRFAKPQAAGAGTYTPVVTPNGSTLAWTMEEGFKTFRLTAEPVKREFAPGMVVDCWGYNGQSPGPTIEAVEGDRVRIYVTNKLPEATTVHWHGMLVPNGMDGVTGLTQKAIEPGETYIYEFKLKQHGTQMYHPHADDMVQMAMGMMGFFVIHPRVPREPKVDRDFCIFLQEWFVEPGSSKPNPMVMTDFNLFTFNSRVYPGTDPLVVKLGQRVRIRFANLSMDSHPIHFHGHHGMVTGTDGGPIPQSGWWPVTTVNVPVGTTRDLEFVADNPGDWPMHCHKNHHAMNAMSHDVPNLIGVDMGDVNKGIDKLLPDYMMMGDTGMMDMSEMQMPLPKNTLPMMAGKGQFGPIGMGGMFTVIKIREGIRDYGDPGWYKQPAGTAVRKA